jgi:DNA-binding MarR family transcriptional regulator
MADDHLKPVAGRPPPSFARNPIHRLGHAHQIVIANSQKVTQATVDLNLGQWRMILFIGLGRAKTLTDISQMFDFNPGYVSRNITRLTEAGLVRSVKDEDDRRRYMLTLTETGQAIFDKLYPRTLRFFGVMLDRFSGEEWDLFFKMLVHIENSAKLMADEMEHEELHDG